MFERWFSAYCLALRTWWLTSRFLTYQSPLRLLSLFETCEQQAHCRNRARIAVGDTVRLVDVERRSHDATSGPSLTVDQTSGETHRRHHVTADGYYKGVQVISK